MELVGAGAHHRIHHRASDAAVLSDRERNPTASNRRRHDSTRPSAAQESSRPAGACPAETPVPRSVKNLAAVIAAVSPPAALLIGLISGGADSSGDCGFATDEGRSSLDEPDSIIFFAGSVTANLARNR